MKYNFWTLVVLMALSFFSVNGKDAIFLKIVLPENHKVDSAEILILPVEPVLDINNRTIKVKVENREAIFEIVSESPVQIFTKVLGDVTYLAEPGDSVTVRLSGSNVSFFGTGSDKFGLVYRSWQVERRFVKPNDLKKHLVYETALGDYFKWNTYANEVVSAKLALLETYRDMVSPFAYCYLKSDFIINVEDNLRDYFIVLAKKKDVLNLSDTDLERIYDSTLARSLFFALGLHNSDTACLVRKTDSQLRSRCALEIRKHRGFSVGGSKSIPSTDAVTKLYTELYYRSKERYSGLGRMRTLQDIIIKATIDAGLNQQVDSMVSDFLAIQGYPKFTDWGTGFIAKRRSVSPGAKAPDFVLTTMTGEKLALSDLKGKFVLLDFWFTGCKGCMNLAPTMKKIEDDFRDNSNIVFLSVSIDKSKEQWKNSVAKRKYTMSAGMHLYTEGLGEEHAVVRDYKIAAYPALFLIDPQGRFMNVSNPIADSGAALATFLSRELATLRDGPYVLYKGDFIVTKYVGAKDGQQFQWSDSVPLAEKKNLQLQVLTDRDDRVLTVKLKKELKTEPSEFSNPSKILALSDIEGNFDAFRNLLQANNVIDKDFNWIFGDGHLVLVGDFVDRGKQVTECLWLIYALEEKAKASGGYVHFILGNHEIMNMNGRLSYVHPKYTIISTSILKESFAALYNEDTEIGRWLRTKNIIEKIGDKLFVHAGISNKINKSSLSIAQINNLIRPVYDSENESRASSDEEVLSLFRSRTSPFWYRGYYKEEYQGYDEEVGGKSRASILQINETLRKFDVSSIITGHTIVADTISAHYAGKVINIDTKHVDGKSEALLVENGKYYRVNAAGGRSALRGYRPAIAAMAGQDE